MDKFLHTPDVAGVGRHHRCFVVPDASASLASLLRPAAALSKDHGIWLTAQRIHL